MVKKYLYELLKVNSRVIIPDLGAFLVKEKPGGKMEVSFNDFLKFNDGLLANKIIKTENISKTDATKKIKEFIKELEDSVKDGGKFVVDNVGIFSKDDLGRLKFEPAKESATKKETKTEPEKKETKEVKEPEKPEEEIKPKEEKATQKETKTEIKAEKKEEKKPEKAAETEKKPLATEKPTEKPTEEDKKEDKLTEKITQKVTKPEEKAGKEFKAKVMDRTETVTSSGSEENGNKALIWVSIIVVVVAAAITWGVLDYDRIAGWFEKENAKNVVKPEQKIEEAEKAPTETEVQSVGQEEDIVEEEPVNEEELDYKGTETVPEQVVEEAKPEKKVAAPKVTAKTGKKYYVIAGSFKIEQNAINYHKKLKETGYNNAQNLGKIKGFYMVAFDVFDNLSDAGKMQKMVLAEQADAWVMRY